MELPQLPRPADCKLVYPHNPPHHPTKADAAGPICCDAYHREALADAVTPQPLKVPSHPLTPRELLSQLDPNLVKKPLYLLQLKAAECPSPAWFRIFQERLMVRPAAQQPLPELLLLIRLHARHDQFPNKHAPGPKRLRDLLAVILLFRPRELESPCFNAVPVD